jgi:hypothetical protein
MRSPNEAPGEQMPQGGEHTGSPSVGGGDCSGAWHQVDSATESFTDTVGCRLVPVYHVIGPADTTSDGHHEDDAGNRVLGNHNSESEELQTVADGSLLGPPITGGSGTCAMGDGQETRHKQGGHLPRVH